MCHIVKTTTIRELKHATTTVLSWVAGGESVEVRRRNEPVAMLLPPTRRTRVVRPDFAARLRAIYGDHVLATTGTDLMAESRGAS
jgi:antitoxin (DNA-binding transcriptional repressor) of toxin-antitoxin stability system